MELTSIPTHFKNQVSAGRKCALHFARGIALVCVVSISAAGCSKSEPTPVAASKPTPVAPTTVPLEVLDLQRDKELLAAEVKSLKLQLEELNQTAFVMLQKVQALVQIEDLAQATALADKLEKRFGATTEVRTARSEISRLQGVLMQREALARQIEARGLYALPTSRSPKLGSFVIKVESVMIGNRWTFDSHGDSFMYRDSRRGEKFVILKTVLQNTDKSQDPDLPDIGVYRIDGKTMTRVSTVGYEFRRWTSYGTFIGLYHDFKNDFAHTASVSFTAAASIDDDAAKAPFAVVAAAEGCSERGSKIGQPEVEYTRTSNCNTKSTLSAEDFSSGAYQVLAFFNKPKGS